MKKKNTNILQILLDIAGAKVGKSLPILKAYFAFVGTFSLTNLSRWQLKSSLRTLERRYSVAQKWQPLHQEVLSTYFLGQSNLETYDFVLLGDETVGKKTGHQTFGIGYHYNSKSENIDLSVAVSGLSVVCRKTKLCLPVCQKIMQFPTERTARQEQKNAQKRAKRAHEKAVCQAVWAGKTPPAAPEKKRGGCKKGTKRASKSSDTGGVAEKSVAYTFSVLDKLLKEFKEKSMQNNAHFSKISIFVGDGAYGNASAAQICRQNGFHLVSRLNSQSALLFPFLGEQKGKGRCKKYGDKIDYKNLPKGNLVDVKVGKELTISEEKTEEKTTISEEKMEEKTTILVGKTERKPKDKLKKTMVYHLPKMLHRNFADPLNVVVIQRLSAGGKVTNCLLFSTDLTLNAQEIIDLFEIRFQIEFVFRDARQYFGLTNFKNVKQNQVENVVDGSFFMTAVARLMLKELKAKDPTVDWSIQDIKAFFRAEKYIEDIFKDSVFDGEHFLIKKETLKIANIGAINKIYA